MSDTLKQSIEIACEYKKLKEHVIDPKEDKLVLIHALEIHGLEQFIRECEDIDLRMDCAELAVLQRDCCQYFERINNILEVKDRISVLLNLFKRILK